MVARKGHKEEWRKADPPEPRLQQQSILGDKQDLCGMEPCVGSPKFLRKTKGGKVTDNERYIGPLELDITRPLCSG